MGKRELHLCDVVDIKGQCDGTYYKTCPLCDTECCTSHFGSGNVYVSIVANASLGAHRTDICKVCTERVGQFAGKINASPLQPLIDPIVPKVIEMLRAALADAALTKTGTK